MAVFITHKVRAVALPHEDGPAALLGLEVFIDIARGQECAPGGFSVVRHLNDIAGEHMHRGEVQGTGVHTHHIGIELVNFRIVGERGKIPLGNGVQIDLVSAPPATKAMGPGAVVRKVPDVVPFLHRPVAGVGIGVDGLEVFDLLAAVGIVDSLM